MYEPKFKIGDLIECSEVGIAQVKNIYYSKSDSGAVYGLSDDMESEDIPFFFGAYDIDRTAHTVKL